jgi:thioesterase domain-containing protein
MLICDVYRQLVELDSRLQKEVRDRLAELGVLRSNVQEEVITRKNLSQSFQSLERRAIKHIEEMVAHKAAVCSALGSKGNASELIAIEQAMEQKAREAEERVKMVHEKMSAAMLQERKVWSLWNSTPISSSASVGHVKVLKVCVCVCVCVCVVYSGAKGFNE